MATRPKRRLTAEERRTGILDAALAVFSERGYHDASIDEIAGEAGVSKALIYEHFSSKQELYGELIARNARDLTQRVAGALSGVEVESTAERLATGLEAFFAFVEERRAAWRMLFRDPSDPESAAVLDRMVGQVTAEVDGADLAGPGRARPHARARRTSRCGCWPRCSWAGRSRWRTGGRDHPDTPRAELVAIAMDFAWLGLERLSRGERWSAPE